MRFYECKILETVSNMFDIQQAMTTDKYCCLPSQNGNEWSKYALMWNWNRSPSKCAM